LLQADEELWATVSELREAVNGTLEKARVGKAIGASLEARVLLHVSDPVLRQRLAQLDAQTNGADSLRYIFIVSQVGYVGKRNAHGSTCLIISVAFRLKLSRMHQWQNWLNSVRPFSSYLGVTLPPPRR
jgi:hypothetical protein